MTERKITHPTRRITSSTPGENLRFVTEQEWKDFEAEEAALIKKHQLLLKNRYGDWSDQEDGYVSPDWVVQDKVPPREGFDQVRWEDPKIGFEYDWDNAVGPWDLIHGATDDFSEARLHVRCRREHLPSEPEKRNPLAQEHSEFIKRRQVGEE